jgi:hypothetical protein
MSTFAPSKGQNNELKIKRIMKTKLVTIKVETLRNGYALEVNGEKFMYFDAATLLEGMLIRVGMERLDELTRYEIHTMVEAVKDGSAIKALETQLSLLRDMNTEYQRQIRTLKRHAKRNKNNND